MKKIAFLISDQHLIPHGGIGSFCKSFCEMQVEFGNEVHIIVDKKPSNTYAQTLLNTFNVDILDRKVQIKYPNKVLSYSTHQHIFMYGESVNFEKIINVQTILLELLEIHTYDYIVVNSQEAFAAIATIDTKTKVILYTHLYKQIYPDAKIHDVFLPAYHRFYDSFLKVDHLIVGTQSERNKQKLIENGSKNVEVLPMPMSEQDLLVENFEERSGVLFIGRWEAGKNPEAYIKVMSETRLPCKVMTNKNGEKKFIKAFKDAGITDYEIKVGITGKEKVDFIKSCQVSFNCSLIENYPFAFIECVGHMPVVVLDTQDWSDNFDKKYYSVVKLSNASKEIIKQYNVDTTHRYGQGSLEYVKQLNNEAKQSWLKL